jgi:DNA-binding winged helix-turn-helix (wHTH) protein
VTYRFARFSANRETRQLLEDGREVHLSPKAFELLLMLIEHRTRAVSKAELQERLWPSTFVGETNLPTLVAEIRRALEDSAQEPAYVRTVHRFGYRFVATVREVAGANASDVASDSAVRMYLTSADRQFELREGAAVIGRAADAAIRIDAGGVSRHHARIVVTGDEARVEDLGSKNGTFVDGQRLAGTRGLADGDEIRLGPIALTFRVAAPTQPTETMG